MLITSSLIIDVLLFLTSIIFLLYKYVTRNFSYWKKRGIYHLKPVPFFGNGYEVITFKTNIGIWLQGLYSTVNQPFFGLYIFDEPSLMIKSPELVKHVLVKDFRYFADRTVLEPDHDGMVSNMLFMKKGPGWRTLRAKLSPVFTSGKLKGMFDIINNVGVDLKTYLRKNLGQLEVKQVCERYSTDVIAICAFSIKAYSFENDNADFRKVGRRMFDFRWGRAISTAGFFFFQKWANLLRLNFFDPWAIEYLKSVFWQTIKLRERSTTKGSDIIDIVVNMTNNSKLCSEINFEGDKVVGQAIQFFAAGFETTSSTMAFTLYQLSIHPEFQDTLRAEIIENIKENNGITYEGVIGMKYLDMCIKETLRMYPVLPFLDRRCNTDYKIPGTDVVIDKGTAIYIPLSGLHYDEKYFPNPYEYNPERFSDKHSYNLNGIYYIPFGEGPRICIGERFGLLSSKLGLVHILSEFVVEKSADTPIPLVYEAKSLVLRSKVGLPMKIKPFIPKSA